MKKDNVHIIIGYIYVYNVIFEGMSRKMVDYFVQQMQVESEMSIINELTFFLGFQVKQMKDGIFIPHNKYAKNILKKFGLDNSQHKRTHDATHIKQSEDEKRLIVDQNLYRSIICSLLYTIANRLDIIFDVGMYAHYQQNPSIRHLTQVK